MTRKRVCRACSQPPRHRYCRSSGTTAASAAGKGAAATALCAALPVARTTLGERRTIRTQAGVRRRKHARKRTRGSSARGCDERAWARKTQACHTPVLMPRQRRSTQRDSAPGQLQCGTMATVQTSRNPRAAARRRESEQVKTEGALGAAPEGRSRAGWGCWHQNRLQGAVEATGLGAACLRVSRQWPTSWPRPRAAERASTSVSNSRALASLAPVLEQI